MFSGPEKRLPVMLCIDVEPDIREIGLSSQEPWRGYEVMFRYFNEMRGRIGQRLQSRVKYIWFWRADPQVQLAYGDAAWALKHYAGDLEILAAQGDELGLHPHVWNLTSDRKRWLSDSGNQEWVNHCISTSVEAYREFFGHSCESVRMGDRWMNQATAQYLEHLGFKYDLTLEPGQPPVNRKKMNEMHTADLPDYRSVPVYPYRAAADDYRQPEPDRREGLLMIPLTGGKYFLQCGRRERMLRRLFRPATLEAWTLTMNLNVDPRYFIYAMRGILENPALTHLALVVRTCIGTKKIEFNNMQENWEFLLSHPRAGEMTFTTAAEAAAIFENRAAVSWK